MSQFVSSNRPTTKLQSMLQNYNRSGKKLQSKKIKSEDDICYLLDRNFFCKGWHLSLLQMLGWNLFLQHTESTLDTLWSLQSIWFTPDLNWDFHALILCSSSFLYAACGHYCSPPPLPFLLLYICFIFLARLNVNLGSRTDKSGDGTEYNCIFQFLSTTLSGGLGAQTHTLCKKQSSQFICQLWRRLTNSLKKLGLKSYLMWSLFKALFSRYEAFFWKVCWLLPLHKIYLLEVF